MLTYEEVNRTSSIVIPEIEARQSVNFLEEGSLERRGEDYTRSYRILVKRVINQPAVAPSVVFVDAVIPEHHNHSGKSPHRSVTLPGQQAKHVCSDICREDSVRLIPVGHEDLLDKLMVWWFLLCQQDPNRRIESMVVEQESAVAQEQIRKAKLYPLFIYDDVQMVMIDSLVKTVRQGKQETWVLV